MTRVMQQADIFEKFKVVITSATLEIQWQAEKCTLENRKAFLARLMDEGYCKDDRNSVVCAFYPDCPEITVWNLDGAKVFSTGTSFLRVSDFCTNYGLICPEEGKF